MPSFLPDVAEIREDAVDDPAYADLRARMEARLLAVLADHDDHDDPKLAEEPCRFKLEPYAGPPDTVWFAYMWFQREPGTLRSTCVWITR